MFNHTPSILTDDLAALVWAQKTIWNNITPDIQEQAYELIVSQFGCGDPPNEYICIRNPKVNGIVKEV
jgi:hypothetical protein